MSSNVAGIPCVLLAAALNEQASQFEADAIRLSSVDSWLSTAAEPEENIDAGSDNIVAAAPGRFLPWTSCLYEGGKMIRGHDFKRFPRAGPPGTPSDLPHRAGLAAMLLHDVVERLARIGDADLPAILLDLSEADDTEDPPANPGHPACAEHADSDYCRESWQLHLAELKCRPETHWHKCDYGRFCAIVPIAHQDGCLAAAKIACLASMPEADFARQVELLDVLARKFAIRHAGYLERLSRVQKAGVEHGADSTESTAQGPERRTNNPRILKAIRNIQEQLADPKLTVGRVARELGMDPSYLGHLFVNQVGRRMSQFIAARRMELAKKLLASTDWQIKRIAHEVGHANANWFCRVFRDFSGLTPGAYRKRCRGRSRGIPK